MKQEMNIVVSPEEADDDLAIKKRIASQLQIDLAEISAFKIVKRSIDARSRNIKINLKIDVYINEVPPAPHSYKINYPNVAEKKTVIVVGAGPAGLFAALPLIEKGWKPIVIERGKM